MKYLFLIVLLIFCFIFPVSGKPVNLLAVSTRPYGSLPLGSSTEIFTFGGGVEASASFFPAALHFFGFGLGSNLKMMPLQSADGMWTVTGFGSVTARFPIGDRFAVLAHGSAGYYYWSGIGWDAAEVDGGGFVVKGGLAATFRLFGPFSLGLGASYDLYTKLYNGISFDLSVRLDIPLRSGKQPVEVNAEEEVRPEPYTEADTERKKQTIEDGPGPLMDAEFFVKIDEIELQKLFPVLYKYYDNHPLGSIVVKNSGSHPAKNIRLQFYVERYMDNPMEIGELFTLGPGEEKQLELYGLFTEELMQITEGTKASAKLSLAYTVGEETYSRDYTPVVEFHNRNALSWDDDTKIASFVTAKDPEILTFAKRTVSWMQDEKNPAVDENLQKGIAVFEALGSYGMQYEIDPTTPFSEFSEDETTIDFLQFPRQTLQFTSGDCDDLSALYTSLLEAVGVETAVITIPGHIYAAFALEAPPDEARRKFSRPDELIFREGKVWVPVEITLCREPFGKAWERGAKEWRENNSRDQAKLYPTRTSWQTYQAVGFKEEAAGIELPDRTTVTEAFRRSLDRHIEKEIYPQVARLHNRMAESETPYKYQNKLAVLYARHGMYEKALETLEEIVALEDYPPAFINLGNIYFLRDEYSAALTHYEKVLEGETDNKTALLGIARCHHELQNYGFVKKTYDELKSVDPDLADRFAYLDLKGEEAGRAAAAAGVREVVLWEEEE